MIDDCCASHCRMPIVNTVKMAKNKLGLCELIGYKYK